MSESVTLYDATKDFPLYFTGMLINFVMKCLVAVPYVATFHEDL